MTLRLHTAEWWIPTISTTQHLNPLNSGQWMPLEHPTPGGLLFSEVLRDGKAVFLKQAKDLIRLAVKDVYRVCVLHTSMLLQPRSQLMHAQHLYTCGGIENVQHWSWLVLCVSTVYVQSLILRFAKEKIISQNDNEHCTLVSKARTESKDSDVKQF